MSFGHAAFCKGINHHMVLAVLELTDVLEMMLRETLILS